MQVMGAFMAFNVVCYDMKNISSSG